MEFDDNQLAFCTAVRAKPRESSLNELLDTFVPYRIGEESGLLYRVSKLEKVMNLLNLEVSPGFAGDLSQPCLVSAAVTGTSEEQVRAEIYRGETSGVEFKSTFSCCLKTFRARSDLEPHQYKRLDVEDSCLSVIAGMMNTNGGVVLIGVEDNRNLVGLSPDYRALSVRDTDRWQLYVRDKIITRFSEGRSVSAHIKITFLELDSVTIARMQIQPRQKATFLNNEHAKCPARLFRRLDNQTAEITAYEVEEFFEDRRALRSS